jgi:hypothetical protein
VEKTSVINQILTNLDACTTLDAPFQHICFQNLLPENMYQELLNNLPPTSEYEELRHYDALLENGFTTRHQFFLQKENIEKLPEKLIPLMTQIAEIFHSEEIKTALFKKFLQKTPDAIPQVILYRDLVGYKIKPHPDIYQKALTFQIYLPENNDHSHLGTVFYEKHDEDFKAVKQIQFSPNSGYAFKVFEDSWHGVEETKDSNFVRNSLMVIYYYSEYFIDGKLTLNDPNIEKV